MKALFFWGKTGSGKTLGVVEQVVKDYALGREIWSAGLDFFKIPYVKVDMIDLIRMVMFEEAEITTDTQKTLVLDEIQTLFDGRRSSSRLNIDLSLFFSQARKRRFNIYYTSQYISGADPRLRQITDYLIRCEPLINWTDLGYGDMSTPEPIAIRHWIWDIQSREISKRLYMRAHNRAFYQFYDTFQVIRPHELYAGVET